ncbi:MAG: hypothetical protein IPL95_13705 [Saprospiraceae bacterium]|nr:hypothetical protein [Saprospiraceae bacterium]
MNYALTASNNFISFPIPTGNISQFQESNISFKVNRNNMSSGTYYSQMFLNINNKLDTIQVKIENFKEQKLHFKQILLMLNIRKRDIIVYIS